MSAAPTSATAEPISPSVLQREPRPRRPRRRTLTVVVIVVLVAAGAVAGAVGRFSGTGHATSGEVDNATSTSLATVTERPLSSQVAVPATLGYAGSYTVINQARGTITALPNPSQVVNQGQLLYAVDGSPVVLLRGATPAYRSLSQGMRGADVRELNAALVVLGEATRATLDPRSDSFSAATTAALRKLQANLGLDPTGSLPLGQAIFLPTAARITAVPATLGAPAQPGAPVLQATSTTRQVTVALDAAQQSEVKVGDQVTISLPNNQTTVGTVSSVGTVATVPSSAAGSGPESSGSSGGTPTIAVDITPADPAATGSLDQAPVQVSITTARVESALVVPVVALLALANGGYAVEAVDGGGTHRLVPVSVGLFDDAGGLVQVTAAGLTAGQHIVVPAT